MTGCRWYSHQPGRLPKRKAIGLAKLILRREKQHRPVNIIIISDSQIRKLNAAYRRQLHPTDVLAFPADPELGVLGDVYISIDTARRQAAEYGLAVTEEILRLVCHGVLHLCGYDHHRKAESAAMKAKERRYLTGFVRHV